MNFKVKTISASHKEISNLFLLDPSFNGWTNDGFYFFENGKLWSSNLPKSFLASSLPEIEKSAIDSVVLENLAKAFKEKQVNQLDKLQEDIAILKHLVRFMCRNYIDADTFIKKNSPSNIMSYISKQPTHSQNELLEIYKQDCDYRLAYMGFGIMFEQEQKEMLEYLKEKQLYEAVSPFLQEKSDTIVRKEMLEYLKENQLYEAIFDQVSDLHNGELSDDDVETEVLSHLSNLFCFSIQAILQQNNATTLSPVQGK